MSETLRDQVARAIDGGTVDDLSNLIGAMFEGGDSSMVVGASLIASTLKSDRKKTGACLKVIQNLSETLGRPFAVALVESGCLHRLERVAQSRKTSQTDKDAITALVVEWSQSFEDDKELEPRYTAALAGLLGAADSPPQPEVPPPSYGSTRSGGGGSSKGSGGGGRGRGAEPDFEYSPEAFGPDVVPSYGGGLGSGSSPSHTALPPSTQTSTTSLDATLTSLDARWTAIQEAFFSHNPRESDRARRYVSECEELSREIQALLATDLSDANLNRLLQLNDYVLGLTSEWKRMTKVTTGSGFQVDQKVVRLLVEVHGFGPFWAEYGLEKAGRNDVEAAIEVILDLVLNGILDDVSGAAGGPGGSDASPGRVQVPDALVATSASDAAASGSRGAFNPRASTRRGAAGVGGSDSGDSEDDDTVKSLMSTLIAAEKTSAQPSLASDADWQSVLEEYKNNSSFGAGGGSGKGKNAAAATGGPRGMPAPPPLPPSEPTEKSKTKNLHWEKLRQNQASDTVWDGLGGVEVEFAEELDEMFAKSEAKALGGGKRGPSGPMDMRRCNNVAIILSKIKLSNGEIAKALGELDASAMTLDQLEQLTVCLPTEDDVAGLSRMKPGDPTNEAIEFMQAMMKLPDASAMARTLIFQLQFDTSIVDVKEGLAALSMGCFEVQNSDSFKEILATVLALGNYLNKGTQHGRAHGFKINSLVRLTDTRAKDSKTTLLHFLINFLSKKKPHLLTFPNEMPHVEEASKTSIRELHDTLQAMKTSLEQIGGMVASHSSLSPLFVERGRSFCATATASTEQLITNLDIARSMFGKLIAFFGENAETSTPAEFFGSIHEFVVAFEAGRADLMDKIRAENPGMFPDAPPSPSRFTRGRGGGWGGGSSTATSSTSDESSWSSDGASPRDDGLNSYQRHTREQGLAALQSRRTRLAAAKSKGKKKKGKKLPGARSVLPTGSAGGGSFRGRGSGATTNATTSTTTTTATSIVDETDESLSLSGSSSSEAGDSLRAPARGGAGLLPHQRAAQRRTSGGGGGGGGSSKRRLLPHERAAAKKREEAEKAQQQQAALDQALAEAAKAKAEAEAARAEMEQLQATLANQRTATHAQPDATHTHIEAAHTAGGGGVDSDDELEIESSNSSSWVDDVDFSS